MIEKILKKKKSTFLYGEVTTVDAVSGRVMVSTGDSTVWIDTSFSLEAGDTVICARDEAKQKFIIQAVSNMRPAVNTLLLV